MTRNEQEQLIVKLRLVGERAMRRKHLDDLDDWICERLEPIALLRSYQRAFTEPRLRLTPGEMLRQLVARFTWCRSRAPQVPLSQWWFLERAARQELYKLTSSPP